MNEPRAFPDVMEQLRAGFARRAMQQRERLKVLTANNSAPNNASEILQICHSLHGSAGVFAHPEIGECARQAEALCNTLIQTQAPAIDYRWEQLAAAVAELCDLIAVLAAGV